MAFKIFGGKEDKEIDEEDFIELDTDSSEDKRKVGLIIDTLNDYRGVDQIQKLVREGNVVLLKIKRMKDRDMGELKRCVERLRKTSLAMNGDIIGVEEDYLILTPPAVKIQRGEGVQQPD